MESKCLKSYYCMQTNHYHYKTSIYIIVYRLLVLDMNISNYIIVRIIMENFHTSVSRWFSLDSFQVSRTLLSILANLKNAVVWVVSIRPLISNFSSPLSKSLGTVPSTPVTIVSSLPSCSTAFLFLKQGLSTCFSFRFL